MLPFLGTQELGKDRGSSRETFSTPGPPLPGPLTPAVRQEKGFCPTCPFCAPFPFSPLSPSVPSSLRASLERGCAPRRPLTPRERNQPALPSLAELPPCAQPLHAGIRAVPSVCSCHPPALCPPRSRGRAGHGGSIPTIRGGLDNPAGCVHGGFQRMHRVCRAAGAAIPAPASSGGIPSQPACAHPQSRLRCARHPPRPLSFPLPDPQSVACRGSGGRQALGDGGEQENGSGIQFTCFVPAGSRRSAARGAAGTQPRPGARGPGLQPRAREQQGGLGREGGEGRSGGAEQRCELSCSGSSE